MMSITYNHTLIQELTYRVDKLDIERINHKKDIHRIINYINNDKDL